MAGVAARRDHLAGDQDHAGGDGIVGLEKNSIHRLLKFAY